MLNNKYSFDISFCFYWNFSKSVSLLKIRKSSVDPLYHLKKKKSSLFSQLTAPSSRYGGFFLSKPMERACYSFILEVWRLLFLCFGRLSYVSIDHQGSTLSFSIHFGNGEIFLLSVVRFSSILALYFSFVIVVFTLLYKTIKVTTP